MTILLTFVAMAAFAANSLLARAALGDGAIDAASFTAIRLVSGAVALVLLTLLQSGTASWRGKHGNWPCAFALFAYAFAFSLAYLRLGAATGALILFTSVQGTMIAWSIGRGEHPTGPEITGLAIAFAAFVYLLLPGLNTPDLAGSLLMMTAGIAWGVYSIRGRGARNPLGETAGNFLRTVAFCIPLALLIVARGHTTTAAIALAVLSGSLTSGVGYAIWYRALPHLSGSQAATVQLTVPILAALGAVMFLSEPLTLRLAVASVCILGGVALAIASRRTAVPR